MTIRPTPEQVLSLARGPSAASAATTVADPGSWSGAGCDDRAVWGAYVATAAEPYEVAVDLSGPAFRCSCPSRKVPCKHCLGLLLLHANHAVAPANRLPFVAQWLQRRGEQSSSADVAVPEGDGGSELPAAEERSRIGGTTLRRQPEGPPDKRKLERAERMAAGLRELDRWLADRVRGGLAAPELADESTWERLAARLVDAQCGGLANRVRRVAAKVGQHSRWHEDVLEEMAMLHTLAVGAQRTGHLPPDLADGIHAAAGLNRAKEDVLAGLATTAHWLVVGESRTAEGRITVQRTWLMAEPDAVGDGGPTWAMLLAFGVFGNEVKTEHPVGNRLHADVHWYPSAIQLRGLVGRVHSEPGPASALPNPRSIADALAAAGWAIAAEPWLERYPLCIAAVPAPVGNGRWALVDPTGSIPIVPGFWRTAEIVSASGGHPITLMGEWSNEGLLPLTMWTEAQVISL